MQTTAVIDEAKGTEGSSGGDQPLRVVVAYDDLGSGQRAMRVLGNVAAALGDAIEFEPMPWSFELLADVDWRKVAASEAVNADIVIIASSSSRPLPPEVGRWTKAAIQQKQGTATAVVALFGPEGNPDGAGSPRLEFIQNATREAGLVFFAPARRQEFEEILADIHRRAEMSTPILAGILKHKAGPDSIQRQVRL
jgi:hypothetical protein